MSQAKYQWHELEDGRGYCSCHIGEGFSLVVLTTPICDSEAEAKRLLELKIELI